MYVPRVCPQETRGLVGNVCPYYSTIRGDIQLKMERERQTGNRFAVRSVTATVDLALAGATLSFHLSR